MNSPASKQTIRAEFLAKRSAIDAAYAKKAAGALAGHLLKAVPKGAKNVAGYLAMRGEIDLSEAMLKLSEKGHALCLPVIVADRSPLLFRRWQVSGALEKGPHGTHEPLATEPPMIPDAVIVPLAAFDAHGHRLGYGAGFYDITIARLRESQPDVKIIGAAFAAQRVARIPHEAHDQKLDAVVTEEGIVIPA